MKVSVITIFHNRENEVCTSVGSLLDQTYNDIEILAIDDGSTDGTLKELTQIKDDRLKVVSQKNMGFVKSMIKAIEMSEGEVIAVHGSGDISYPDRIKKQVKVLKNNKSIGVVSCNVENFVINENTTRLMQPNINDLESMSKQLLKKNPFTHGEIMFRKDIYNRAGGYRAFFKYSQDHDLWLRMSLLTDFFNVNEVLYKRIKFEDGVSTSVDKLFQQTIYSEFSKQSFQMRLKEGTDFIDLYGETALVFFDGKKADGRLMYLALSRFIKGNIDDALHILIKARQINKSLYNLMMFTLSRISKKYKIFYDTISFIFYRIKNIKDRYVSVRAS